ncbi:MAG: hypothetical protein EZS28_006372 [Streblomastix strix]|uniref:Uncharacterized protein n=1 Tax=Streblomastix strix TaxID=222440 RepID=A0A5J4WUJ3_9EUKA|nr:MAG: hypothetical protein EZS28_006372 [Streblomastix strix]
MRLLSLFIVILPSSLCSLLPERLVQPFQKFLEGLVSAFITVPLYQIGHLLLDMFPLSRLSQIYTIVTALYPLCFGSFSHFLQLNAPGHRVSPLSFHCPAVVYKITLSSPRNPYRICYTWIQQIDSASIIKISVSNSRITRARFIAIMIFVNFMPFLVCNSVCNLAHVSVSSVSFIIERSGPH